MPNKLQLSSKQYHCYDYLALAGLNN